MIYCGTWCAGIFDADGFTDYAYFRMPAIDGGKGDPNANFLVPEGLMVSAKTKHPKEAVEWASFLVSDDIAAKFAELLKIHSVEPGTRSTTIAGHDRAVQMGRQGCRQLLERHQRPRRAAREQRLRGLSERTASRSSTAR